MHTVIITDRQTTPLFTMHRRLFAPFFVERGGIVCHCPWNESGNSIEQAVPELYEAIKGYPEWRVIILINPTQSDLLPYNPNNPFDFACNHGSEIQIGENFAPLVRLTHMLAGFPPLGIKEYQTGYTYYSGEDGKFLECKTDDGNYILQSDVEKLTDDERKTLFEKFGGNIRSRLLETPYSDEEKAEHKRLTKKYAFKENRPVEVLILSTRELYMPDDREATREAVRHAWQSRDDEESSDFWKVYPNTCRFLCYNLINPEHTLYPRELWRFCLLTLTLAVNQIPGQTLQAYRLYKADLNISVDELKLVIDEHIENLMSVQAIIQERILRVPDLTQEKKKELVPEQYISVKFEQVDEGEVRVDSSKLGLAADCPISETRFWRRHIQGTRQTIDNILSAPQEVVVEKALESRRKANSYADKEQVLDRFQLNRVRKRMDELESQVINANVYGMLDSDAHKAEVAEAGNTVRKFLGLRLTKRNVLLISLSSLLVYLCGYIPYFINSAKISWPTFGAAFGLTVIALVLLAAGGLLILWFLRRRVVKKMKDYNKNVMGIFDRVNNGGQVYSEYFSSVCTYMYAQSLLSGVVLKHDNDYSATKIQKAHLACLENEIEANIKLCSLYKVPANNSSVSNTFMDIKEESLLKLPSESQMYELASYKVKNTLELDNNGDMLDAPYSFIVGLSLSHEELYEKKGVGF